MADKPLEINADELRESINNIYARTNYGSDEKKTEQQETDEETKERLKSVVSQENLVVPKKSLGKKFLGLFISEDIVDVKDYVVKDVIVPGVGNAIIDILEGVFFGTGSGGRRRSRRDYDDGGSYSYSSCYRSSNQRSRRRNRESREKERKINYRNIVVIERRDAEEIVEKLRSRIKRYDQACVADLYDLIDITPEYTDWNWGWTDPGDIGIKRVSDGYLIDVAEPIYLD